MGVYEQQIVPIKISRLAEYVSQRKRIALEDAPAAIAELRAYKTYNQLSFHTPRVILALRFVESYEVTE